jgi:hypothetical protein
MSDLFDSSDLIDVYTRAEAIEDGVLVDVTSLAREAGIKFPVAITQALFELLDPDEDDKDKLMQDFTGRLWDVFTIFKAYAKKAKKNSFVFFHLAKVHWPTKGPRRRLKGVKAVLHPGDKGEPVLTFMMPDED